MLAISCGWRTATTRITQEIRRWRRSRACSKYLMVFRHDRAANVRYSRIARKDRYHCRLSDGGSFGGLRQCLAQNHLLPPVGCRRSVRAGNCSCPQNPGDLAITHSEKNEQLSSYDCPFIVAVHILKATSIFSHGSTRKRRPILRATRTELGRWLPPARRFLPGAQ